MISSDLRIRQRSPAFTRNLSKFSWHYNANLSTLELYSNDRPVSIQDIILTSTLLQHICHSLIEIDFFACNAATRLFVQVIDSNTPTISMGNLVRGHLTAGIYPQFHSGIQDDTNKNQALAPLIQQWLGSVEMNAGVPKPPTNRAVTLSHRREYTLYTQLVINKLIDGLDSELEKRCLKSVFEEAEIRELLGEIKAGGDGDDVVEERGGGILGSWP